MRGAAVHHYRTPLAAAGAFALLLAAAPAHAGNVPVTDNGGSTLTIDLKGSVTGHCGFSTPPPSSASVDLTTEGSQLESFVLDCNTPFRLRVSSANGLMALQNPPAGAPDAFGQSDPYMVEVSFKTDVSTIDESCASAALRAQGASACDFFGTQSGQGVSSGDGVSIGQNGSLKISWSTPTTTLVAGQYQDTLTIVVEPRS